MSWVPVGCFSSLSKTTKLILLDSLLQEVCISSGKDGSLALSSLGLSVCLSQSQTYFLGAKESPLTIGSTIIQRRVHVSLCLAHTLCTGVGGGGAVCTLLQVFFGNLDLFLSQLVHISAMPHCRCMYHSAVCILVCIY